MDKQIEELAKDLQEAWTAWTLSADLTKPWTFVAEILAKKWQPKVPECVVDYIENYKEGFKEGVEAMGIQLRDKIVNMNWARDDTHIKLVTQEDCLIAIYEICKELVNE